MKCHQLTNGCVQLASDGCGETNQDYSRGLHVGDEHKPAEVFASISRILSSAFASSFPINGSPPHLAHSQNVMAIRTERSHNREVTALVREKAHRGNYRELGAKTDSWAMASAAYTRQARMSSAVSLG